MREIRPSGSEGGAAQTNEPSLPLSPSNPGLNQPMNINQLMSKCNCRQCVFVIVVDQTQIFTNIWGVYPYFLQMRRQILKPWSRLEKGGASRRTAESRTTIWGDESDWEKVETARQAVRF